jgi:hypothetical protein
MTKDIEEALGKLRAQTAAVSASSTPRAEAAAP